MPPAIAVPPALLSLILHAFAIPLFDITAARLCALVTSPFFATSTIADSQARHPPLPAVSVDQNPSLPALPPRIVPIQSASSCSPHQYAVNYPHSLLLLHSLLCAQDSALCAFYSRRPFCSISVLLASPSHIHPASPSDVTLYIFQLEIVTKLPFQSRHLRANGASSCSVNRILPPPSFIVGFVQKAREGYKREDSCIHHPPPRMIKLIHPSLGVSMRMTRQLH
ncbi:hypothetical protein C8J57DRAFT_1530886 [Mycena rebaudengoi]|nr:hypothetical protein C8J57DRAFT_1530886 [Mycena rebaudengoi]